MTATQLFEQTVKALFVNSDVPENLLGVDQNNVPTYTVQNGILPGFFNQFLYDCQRYVPCYRFANSDRYDHCAQYFQCGMTVVPKPRGVIRRIYVVDRINPDTGLEDATSDLEWCAKVHLSQVEYCRLNSYMRLCERCGTTNAAVADALITNIFGIYRIKRHYPKPTTLAEMNTARIAAGEDPLPALPDGFHYPDDSTDATGRSPSGVFAFNGGRIYVAPWLQSTETLVVDWTGIKRTWGDADLVEDDPKFTQAARLHVGEQYERCYGDSSKASDFHDQLFGNPNRNMIGVLPELIHECAEEMRAFRCGEATSGAGDGAAQGIGVNVGASSLFYNERQEFTATCPAGKTGTPVTAVVEAGTVGSSLSVADANGQARQVAEERATAGLVCVDEVITYSSVATIGHASCPGAQEDGTPASDGNPVSVPVPAGYRTSIVSQAAADAAAQAAADALAEAQLSCTFWNKEQTATYHCPADQTQTGPDGTATIAAHTYSNISQALADADAYAEALRLAKLATTCDAAPPVLFGNTPQTVGPLSKQCVRINPITMTPCTYTLTATINVGAGRRFAETQNQANADAQNYALQLFAAQPCNNTTCLDQVITVNI